MEINVCTMYEPVTFISRWVYLQWGQCCKEEKLCSLTQCQVQ